MENKDLFKGKIHSKLSLGGKVILTQEIVSELVKYGTSNDIGKLYNTVFNDVDKSSFIIEYRLMTYIELPVSVFGKDIFGDSESFVMYGNKTYYISDYKGYIIITKNNNLENPYKIMNYTSDHMRQFYNSISNILSNLLLYAPDLDFENDIIACKKYLEEVEGFKKVFLNFTSKYEEFKKATIENRTRKEIYTDIETIAIKKRLYRKLSDSPKKYIKLFSLKNEKYGNNILDIIYEYYLEYLNYKKVISLDNENTDEEIKTLLNSLFENLWFVKEEK